MGAPSDPSHRPDDATPIRADLVAAAVLGDASLVDYVPLTAEARFTALQSEEIDVLIRNTTWTATRDGQEGGTFLYTVYFDGQGMMVPRFVGC